MNAFLAACQQIVQVLPCCLPSARGTTVSSVGSCSSPIHESNQHLYVVAFFSPLLCSITIFQASTTVTGALSALSQHCTVRCLCVSGWWVEQPVSHRVRGAGSVPQWANLKTPLGQIPAKSRTNRWSQLQELKTWKPTGMPACLPYLPGRVPFGKNSLVLAIEGGGLHDFKHFYSRCLSSLLIKTMRHISFIYMELWN